MTVIESGARIRERLSVLKTQKMPWRYRMGLDVETVQMRLSKVLVDSRISNFSEEWLVEGRDLIEYGRASHRREQYRIGCRFCGLDLSIKGSV
jgi:hypothetical protein